ncbi:efflux transporter outer membrane subunit [Xylophilus sp.]|uniref:efflux transporter outer membrane subunit n=1 Tax=Xylophilus sp. TaxID=2653893 RepID=UPI0013BDD87E|nr:efflux transporter outer membrane subunit [Xylophilus sp.]KAF1042804.1 MAG: Multidrug/solvent efflux pump outer membrane protein MepC [Xylophilus sp.]
MPSSFAPHLHAAILCAALAGCASVGPDFQTPQADAPAGWAARPSSAPGLAATWAPDTAAPPAAWWRVFRDPVLDRLEARAAAASPDLRTAALRFAQSRLQRSVAAAQATPQAGFQAQATRQRQSETSAETRLVGAIAGAEAPRLVDVLSDPFPLYQAGFDVSWELDLWGRVRRSVEAADAAAESAGAQFEDARLVVSAEVARAYAELRQLQRQQALLARDAATVEELLALQQARVVNGLADEDAPLAQSQALAGLRARQAAWQAQHAALLNQIGLLTGDAPGALTTLLAPAAGDIDGTAQPVPAAPALGQPAELLRRRPDVRAAEAQLHAATAEIGVAMADLYPRIALDASAGVQSIGAGSFGEWASRTWQIGPVLSLPVFDGGRRRANVELRRIDQQRAAVAWRQSVLKAWQEVDDALAAHAAERLRNQRLREQVDASRTQLALARARTASGLVSELAPLQAERALRQAQSLLCESDGSLRTSLVRLYKAAGGGAGPSGTVE